MDDSASPPPATPDELLAVRQDALLRRLHADTLAEPLPPEWTALARGAARRRQVAQRWQWLGGLAASVLVSFAAGWLAHLGWNRSEAAQARGFAREAAVAHAVFTPEVRHPVEVPAAQQDHLVQWLSKRLGRPLKVPQLQDQGYSLVGGRLLPGDDGARAQFMFQDADGKRLTLYVGGVDARAARQGETAFQFSDEQGVARFYWTEDGAGYALAGALPRARLLDIAQVVYQQVSPR